VLVVVGWDRVAKAAAVLLRLESISTSSTLRSKSSSPSISVASAHVSKRNEEPLVDVDSYSIDFPAHCITTVPQQHQQQKQRVELKGHWSSSIA
jgi:hypothetical protein